jgi:HlyD family secretion protein
MNSTIFRKASLDRLSCPDELDRLLTVTDSKAWIAQFAVFALLAVACVWAYVGRVPSTVAGQGILVRRGGVLNLVASGSGVIAQLNVGVGDKIHAHQVVAKITQPALIERLRGAEESLAQAQRDRSRSRALLENESKLNLDTIQRKRTNMQAEITHLQERLKLAEQQVNEQDQLLSYGIVTKQKTIEARQNVVSVEDEIAGLQANLKELDAEEFSGPAKVQQSDAEKESHVQDLERNVSEIKKQLEIAEDVISPYGGEVLELKVLPGTNVDMGEPILSIQPDVQDLQVLIYLPAAQAKNVHAGMDVDVSPSNVKREEYGFVRGRVSYVSDFPDTPAELMRNLQNEVLVKALTNDGPVTEIQIEMEKNPNTPSGYQWSSSKGSPLSLSSGTLCSAQIVTQWQRPVALILPSLRRTLGLN